MTAAKKDFTTEDTEITERKAQLFTVDSVTSVVRLFKVWFHI